MRTGNIGKKLYLCFVVSLVTHTAYAGAGWTDYANVSELNPKDLHYYSVRIDVKENPSRCDASVWFYQDYDRRGADKMFDVLLEALVSGLKVRVYVTGKCNLQDQSEISSVSIAR